MLIPARRLPHHPPTSGGRRKKLTRVSDRITISSSSDSHCCESNDDVLNDFALDISQSHRAAGVAVGQALVVEAQEVTGSLRASRARARGYRPLRSRGRRFGRKRDPALTPPPAIQRE